MTNGNFGDPPGGGFGAPPSGGGGAPPAGGGGGGGFGQPPAGAPYTPPAGGGGGGFGQPPAGGGGGGFGQAPAGGGGGFGQPPAGGGFGQPPAGGGGGFGGPPSPVQGPRGAATFSEAMDVAKELMRVMPKNGILGAFIVVAVASLIALTPMQIGNYLRLSSLEQLGPGGDITNMATSSLLATGLSCFGWVLLVVVLTVRLGLAASMQKVIMEGEGSVNGVGDALRMSMARFGPNLAILLLYMLAVAVGTLLCILPGIAAAVILYPATYLVATGRSVGDSFSMSWDWMSRHTSALLGTFGVVFLLAVLIGCCNGGINAALVSGYGLKATFFYLPLGMIVSEVVGIVSLTLICSGLIASDQADMGSRAAAAPNTPTTPAAF